MAPAPLISPRALTLLLVTGVLGIFIVRPLLQGEEPLVRTPSVTNGASAAEAIGAFKVRDMSGAIVPLVTPGEPQIIMVSSTSCGWCKRALRDIGEMANGRPVPRLKLLTLEGASLGAPMLAQEKITGAQLLGPAGDGDQVLLTFRYPGTPTFVAIDKEGRVARTMPGYPIREEMQHWFAVMVGASDVP
jgi:hypothetical protein